MATNNPQSTLEKEADALQNSRPIRENSPRINQLSDGTTDLLTPGQQRERILTLFVIALISLLTGIDYAIILPTAWNYVRQFIYHHYAGFTIGILLSVFALSGAIAGIIFGYLDDIGVSLKRLILVGITCLIIGNIFYFIGINIYVVILSRLIAGIGMGLVPPLLAEISRRSTPETRTQLFAKILGCRQIGLFLGPCFTVLLKQFDFKLFGLPVTVQNAPGLLMAILWFIVILLTMCFFYDAPIRAHDAQSLSNIIRNNSCCQACQQCGKLCKNPVILVLLITSFIAYFNQTALETALTPFTNQQFNWGEIEISFLFAVAGVEIVIVYIGLHYISKKVHDQTILAFAYVILTFACLIGVVILPFSKVGSTKFLPIFLLFVALDIFALPLIAVTTTTLYTREVNKEQQGIGQGIQRSVVNIATIIGPLYAGALLKTMWIMLVIMFGIILIATVLVLCTYRSFRSRTNDELETLIPSVDEN
ncbi:unnamed protein product [Adineta ricciae]|uniref:Major facilitator superfamily (MFS) profile domain-containing protein n=1 Tax=Adineta ricciae TaxID=249248 RepID=A0A814GE44_ADIRI|nr:unnamed protein product [Adineta ricciae]CAF1284928.1 unnamed protein product [Adineta ricciae]